MTDETTTGANSVGAVLFVGAGTMGCANSLIAAARGHDVIVQDLSDEALGGVAERHAQIADFLVASGYCSSNDIDAALGRVSLATDLADALSRVDLVSESVFEDLELKRKVHATLDGAAPPHVILTTNSSALMVSEIEDVVARGERFAALHSHLGSLLFDIVGGPRTSPATIATLRAYVHSLGGIPLVSRKENRGYIFNAMNGRVLVMALRLVVDAHAQIEAVDRAWMTERGAPMGPFGMMDLFGLDLVLGNWRNPSDDPWRDNIKDTVVSMLSVLVDEGSLGQKTGKGFYRYPNPTYQDSTFLSSEPVDPAISAALTSSLLLAALTLTANGVAEREDVDLAWTVATGLDTGPFGILDRLQDDALVEMLEAQVAAGLRHPDEISWVASYLGVAD